MEENRNGRLHLIMPMGGGGTRFGNKGFNVPKPLIELQGRPFFYWAAQSVLKFVPVKDITFVVLQEHIDRFGIDSAILQWFPAARIRVIPHVLNGAVLTCLEGVKVIEDGGPILFNDCDHAFMAPRFEQFCLDGCPDDVDGALLTFISDSPNFSYVRFAEDGRVCGTVEKEVVSSEAICGAYYFRNRELFETAAAEYLEHCSYKEFFMSGVYNELADRGCRIVTFPIDEHISFGTPEEYDLAVTDTRLAGLKSDS